MVFRRPVLGVVTGILVLATQALAAPPPASGEAAPPAVSATWSGTRFEVDQAARVSGTVTRARSLRAAVLQRRTPDGWRSVARLRLDDGRFAGRVPTTWYGSFRYRVRVTTRGGTVGWSDVATVRVVPSYDPPGVATAHRLASPSPVARWDPCRVIGYRVNARQARPGALRDVKGALRRVHQATGLRFAYRGTTRLVPQSWEDSYPRDTQLVIAWARPGQSLVLGRSTGAMGVGGAAWQLGYRDARGTTVSRIVRGYVVIDASQQSRTPAGFGRGKTRGELLMHESAHAMGLSHVEDRRQLMHPFMQETPARWGRGDLAGLAKLGAARGCLHQR
jgi:hypothetical protein